MRRQQHIVALFLSLSTVHGFIVTRTVVAARRVLVVELHVAGEDDEKEVVQEVPASVSTRKQRRKQRKSTTMEPIASAAKSIPIQDIRKLAATNDAAKASSSTSLVDVDTSSQSTSMTSIPDSVTSDDPLAQLLKDAESLRAKDDASNQNSSVPTDSSSDWKVSIRNVLSTIVTVDFFVVCGLLLWFIAGIISSVFFRNDAIQLGFNGIFESVVQPALGILMMASISDAVLKESDG